jgi:hypothetical protein
MWVCTSEALNLLGLLPRNVARCFSAHLKAMQFCPVTAELHGSSREGTCDVSTALFERHRHKTLFRLGNAKPGGLNSPGTHSRLHRLQGPVRLSGGDAISLMRIHGH